MLALILAAGSAICLSYFIAIVIYSGIGTSSIWIWLCFAAGLGFTAASLKLYEREPERIALWVPVSLVTLCASGMVILLVLQILMFARIPVVAESGLDYLIVLGAQVKDGAPSSTLRLRLDKAAEYAGQNPETTLILSGGMGDEKHEAEAQVMRRYLLEKGVPEERMLLEERSSSTLENLVFSQYLLDGQIRRNPARIGVLTSNFHLYRAKMIARKHDMDNICGIASESDRVLFFHFCLRDALAILKDRIAGNL